MGSRDHVRLRNYKRYDRMKLSRLHKSVDDLYPDDCGSSTCSEEDHLARVSHLKNFFENLSKSDIAGNELGSYSVTILAAYSVTGQ